MPDNCVQPEELTALAGASVMYEVEPLAVTARVTLALGVPLWVRTHSTRQACKQVAHLPRKQVLRY